MRERERERETETGRQTDGRKNVLKFRNRVEGEHLRHRQTYTDTALGVKGVS